jgi:hypothetical protein
MIQAVGTGARSKWSLEFQVEFQVVGEVERQRVNPG